METDSIGNNVIKNNKKIDKYRTLKTSFNKIKKDIDYSYMLDVITRTNKLVIYGYQFTKLFILFKIKMKQEIPIITESFIVMVFKALTNDSAGPKPKGDNLKMFIEFNDFYKNHFGILINFNKIDSTNLSSILQASAIDMVTNIENNIKQHFLNHLRKFVNQMFKKENNDILQKIKDTDNSTQVYYKKKNELRLNLYTIKKDLEDNTNLCNKQYHKWLQTYRKLILPTDYIDSYSNDISCNPQKYLKYSASMNVILEKNDLQMFQFFPLRTEIIKKYIPLDTKTIVDIFLKNKNMYFNNIEKYKNKIWSMVFNMNNKVFKMKNYTFNGLISTDGYSVSVCFIHNNFYEAEILTRKNRLIGRQYIKTLNITKTPTEIEILNKKRKEDKKKKEDANKLATKKYKEKCKVEFKKLSKDEQQKVKEEMKIKKHKEFPYLDELTEIQKKIILNKKKVYIDPGKRSLFYMIDDNDKIFNYTNKTRIYETKRKKYTKLIENFKNKHKIIEKETVLSDYNSKTCNYKNFKKYIQKKTEVNNLLFKEYDNIFFRKLKWYSFINTERSEANLLNKIEEIYGKDIVIIIGDWSTEKQMKHFISTPNISLKRLLATKFPVFTIDEFRTSCLHHKTENRVKNIYLPDKKKILRKIHSILTYKMETNRLGCINRDNNGVKNIRKLALLYLKYNIRPYNYQRNVKNTDIIETEPEKYIPLEEDILIKNIFKNDKRQLTPTFFITFDGVK